MGGQKYLKLKAYVTEIVLNNLHEVNIDGFTITVATCEEIDNAVWYINERVC